MRKMTPFLIVLILVIWFFSYKIRNNYVTNSSDNACQNIENLSSSELETRLKNTKWSCCKCKISILINNKEWLNAETSNCDKVCGK